MRVRATLWLIAACFVSAASRSDRPLDAVLLATENTSAPLDPSKDPVYVCPMDPDVRSHNPGSCRRCGMALVAGIPDPVEYHVDLGVKPQPPRPGDAATLQFLIHDPWKDRPVAKYNLVHEKLFHAFVVSEDLQFFRHAHPTPVSEGVFELPITFPGAGMFRVLADFYPSGATPQLATQTVFVPGAAPSPVQLTRDYSPKSSENMRVSMTSIPEQAVAGMRTQLRFTIDPVDGLEKYLGAWAHMLAASNDLIDMIHQHPFRVDEQQMVEFVLVFPRPQVYRVWVQFQRKGIVNTVHFDVPVRELE